MLIYKDILTGDEVLSDVYKMETICNGAIIKVKGKMVTMSDDVDNINIGANASQEEQAEQLESTAQQGVDIVLKHRLCELPAFGKMKEYTMYLKDYLKKIQGKLQEKKGDDFDCKCFQKNCMEFVTTCVKQDFKEFQFFSGESMDPEGMIILMKYVDDKNTELYFFTDGMEAEKV